MSLIPPRLRIELGQLALDPQALLLGQPLQGAVLGHLLHVLQPLDRLLDRLVVGEHAAEPAVVHERRPAAGSLLADDVARLALGAHEQDRALVRGELAHEFQRLVVLLEGALEVDDVDLVALAEDERRHLRVPVAGLVAEVDPGLQHFSHRDCHELASPVKVEPPSASTCPARRAVARPRMAGTLTVTRRWRVP